MKYFNLLFSTALVFFTMSLIAGNKTYQFTYDANGNRTTVAFNSTCNANRERPPLDSLKIDSTDNIAIKQIQAVQAPTAYPNPAKDFFILSFSQLDKMAQLALYDFNGAIVLQDDNINTLHTVIKTCNLPAGMYMLVVQYGAKEPFVQKIIKQ